MIDFKSFDKYFNWGGKYSTSTKQDLDKLGGRVLKHLPYMIILDHRSDPPLDFEEINNFVNGLWTAFFIDDKGYFCFTEQNDAMAFKLRWT